MAKNKKINKREKHGINNELIRILNILLSKDTQKKRKKQKSEVNLEKLLENSKEKLRRFDEFIPKESYHIFIHEKNNEEEKISVRYSVVEEDSGYSVAISYDNSSKEERLQLKAESTDEMEKYSITITKPDELLKYYAITIEYETPKEKISFEYIVPVRSYREEREEKLQDFTNKVDKSLAILPKSVMGGVLGFTYIGENYMARRDDLTGSTANMVDVHETIHTPDEYETRILTSWMLTREKPRYKN